ncbi:hypothetical protein O7600_16510 [Micromonospora sp. WMMA1998]|uniref:hypothetical protein n=1 Tax=Micromonospora sp. WMMA1998 TaxID=3015167 RepID=UPI00248B0A27|nr:hypothetical protein [Micromonospora sp. WMMA1998]WBC12786.1 hypothetical protein O7600_16510 [Micromonospora sp. WMMA1998]
MVLALLAFAFAIYSQQQQEKSEEARRELERAQFMMQTKIAAYEVSQRQQAEGRADARLQKQLAENARLRSEIRTLRSR